MISGVNSFSLEYSNIHRADLSIIYKRLADKRKLFISDKKSYKTTYKLIAGDKGKIEFSTEKIANVRFHN